MKIRSLFTLCGLATTLVACAITTQTGSGPTKPSQSDFPEVAKLTVRPGITKLRFSESGEHLFLGNRQHPELLAIPLEKPQSPDRLSLGFYPWLLLAPPDENQIFILGQSPDDDSTMLGRLHLSGLEEGKNLSDLRFEKWPLGRPHFFFDGTFSPQAERLYYTDLDSSAIYVVKLDDLDKLPADSVVGVSKLYLENGPGSIIAASEDFLAVLHVAASRKTDVSLLDPRGGSIEASLSNSDRGVSTMALARLTERPTTGVLLFLDEDGSTLRSRQIYHRTFKNYSIPFAHLSRGVDKEKRVHGFSITSFGFNRLVLGTLAQGSPKVDLHFVSFRGLGMIKVTLNRYGSAVADRPVDDLAFSSDGQLLATVGGGLLTVFDLSGP